MKIDVIKAYRLRNDEHFWFMTEVKNIIEAAGARYLNIEDIFSEFVELYEKENCLLKKENKTQCSNMVEESDTKRDDYHRGIELIIKGNLRHSDLTVRSAAKKLKQILDKYGDLRPLPYDEETVAINNFCADMDKQKSLVEKLHLTEWVEMLKTENNTFQQYFNQFQQYFSDDNVSLKTIRRQLDQFYDDLIIRVEALTMIKGDWKYHDFVNQLNKAIESISSSTTGNQDIYPPRTNEKYTPETFY